MINKDKIMRTFGERFTEYMVEHNLRDIDMAKLLNMSSMNMPAYKNGARLTNPWYLVLIAEKFDCTVNDLLGFNRYRISSCAEREPASKIFSSINRYEIYFKNRLADMMKNRSVSISELARLVNKTEGTIRNVWLGNQPVIPNVYSFLDVCDALDCTPSDLLGY